jgi:RNA polymerase sigma-70 factor (ECF subfamily)
VLQSAIASAFRDFDLYAAGTNFRAWIFRYVHLEICNRNRKEERHRHAPLPDELPIEETWDAILNEPLLEVLLQDPEIVLEDCEEELAEAVWSLSALERAVFLLRVLGEFKYREIAEILSVPIGTVMGTLARSRMRLRQRLVEFGLERGLLKPI